MAWGDVREGHLHVIQQKTGTLLRLPLELRLNVIGLSLGEAIEASFGTITAEAPLAATAAK